MIWRGLLWVFALLIVLDGAIRKWMLPEYGDIIYIAKDAFIAVAALLFFMRYRPRLPEGVNRTSLPLWLALYVTWAIIDSFNPHLPGPAVALLGFRSHVLYMSLLVIVPAVLSLHRGSLLMVTEKYVLFLVVPVLLFGAFQYFQPVDSWANRYAADTKVSEIATAGLLGRARITGTFSYISGMATFVLLNIGVGLGLVLGAFRFGGRYLRIGAVTLALAVTVAPMTGSRATLYLPLFTLPLLLLQSMSGTGLRRYAAPTALVSAVVLVVVSSTSLGEGWVSFGERVQEAGDTRSRIEAMIRGPIQHIEEGGMLGYGTGTTHQAAPRLVPTLVPYEWLPTTDFEEENGRIALELGLFGLIAYVGLKLTLVKLAVEVSGRAVSAEEVLVGTVGVVLLASHLALSVVFNPVAAAFYWGSAGAVLSMWSRQKRRVDSERALRISSQRDLARAMNGAIVAS